MKSPQTWLPVVIALLLTSCSSSGGSSDDWSRTYFAPRDKVIDAVIDVLEDEGYLVDADREKGRVSAEPSRGSAGSLVSLVVRVTQKNDRIRVDVQTRTGASYSTMTSKPQESTVLEFFHELDLRLHSGQS
jgi:hypothetical protein